MENYSFYSFFYSLSLSPLYFFLSINLPSLGLSEGYHNNLRDFIDTQEIFNHDCLNKVRAITIENLECAYEILKIVVISQTKFMIPE